MMPSVTSGRPTIVPRRGDACVAAQRQLEAAAQRRAVQRRDDGLAAVFDGSGSRQAVRLGQRLAELAQVGARDEGVAGTDQHGAAQARVDCAPYR